MKLEVLVDGDNRGAVELAGPGIIPYAGVVSSFCQIIADIYLAENPDGADYLTISGAEVSLRSRVRRTPSRRRRAS